MPQWMQDLITGWPMIRANLPTFFVLIVLIIVVIWWVMSWRYGDLLAAKNGQIELQDRQLADYREKLKGASPEEAKAKIDALERTIKLTVGARWEPLTKAQISTLAVKLRAIKKGRAQIMYENALGKELAQTILEAFKEAQWEEAWLSSGSDLGEGVVVGWSSNAAEVGKALVSAAKLPVWEKDTDKEVIGLIVVGVGINAY